MGRTDTTHAAASTSISYMKGIDMNKLLDEIKQEYESSRPPKEAITVRQLADSSEDMSMSYARNFLADKVKNEGWKSTTFKRIVYFWK